MQVCISLETDNPTTLKFFTDQMPFLPPNQQRQSTKDIGLKAYTISRTVGDICFIHPTDKCVLSLLRQLSVWCCLHLLLSAGARSTPTVYTCPSISSAHRVLSSKLAIHHCCCRSMGQTDGRTDTRRLHSCAGIRAASVTVKWLNSVLGRRICSGSWKHTQYTIRLTAIVRHKHPLPQFFWCICQLSRLSGALSPYVRNICPATTVPAWLVVVCWNFKTNSKCRFVQCCVVDIVTGVILALMSVLSLQNYYYNTCLTASFPGQPG